MKRLFFLLLPALFFSACQDDDDSRTLPECGTPIEITGILPVPDPDPSPGDHFDLLEISTEGTCLTVRIGGSGCSDESWDLSLSTEGLVAESLPTQTLASLFFDDGVEGGSACLAYFNRSYEFDLSPYLTTGVLPTTLSVVAFDSIAVLSIE